MAQQIPDTELVAIEQAVRAQSESVSAQEILRVLRAPIPLRTLQYRLNYLVTRNRLVRDGKGRSARYRPAETGTENGLGSHSTPAEPEETALPLSSAGEAIRNHVRQRLEARAPAGYSRRFLESYRPNSSSYLSEQERAHLTGVGGPEVAEQPAGTYARHILNRLLVDLSWNSSRLEGNSYSLLDTRRLIAFGQEAEGRAHRDAQMILNHKDAIEFLVSAADEIGFNRYTILNLHALLANNLLTDSTAAGRLRYIAVGIERSSFHPLEVPQIIEECFEQILATATAIRDPFEQAFFVMVQIPYLQPFDDVNKRVSRLAANIPLIKGNLCPLSFVDVPKQLYTEAMLGIYEMNDVNLLKDVFVWAYERSAARYTAVRQSLGEPDPFRFRYRAQLREIIAHLIRTNLARKDAAVRLADWSDENIEPRDREQFDQIVESELTNLHEGNFARYGIRPSEFAAWRKTWDAR